MQNIAAENNLSETAFYIKKGSKFHIRWFTPLKEVALCGHATLASAYVEFFIKKNKNSFIVFDSQSGELKVNKDEKKIVMDFPADKIKKINAPKAFFGCFDRTPEEIFEGSFDYMLGQIQVFNATF